MPTKEAGGRVGNQPANPSGVRKQGGRKDTKKTVGTRPNGTQRKRSGSTSGGGKSKTKV